MKTLQTVELVGSRQCRATNWQLRAGYAQAVLTDGSRIYCGDVGIDAAVTMAESQGVNCADFKARLAKACARFEPSPEERDATEYQDRLGGYSVPVMLGGWEFSHTFGRWGRFVTFRNDDGPTFTYPKR